jgi:ABC-type nitrate/sulfonate/bicarbonate transport system substrate-binding protein
MRRFFTSLSLIACAVGLLRTDAWADVKVRLGFPVQVHTANVMQLRDRAKKSGVDLDVSVMRGYPNIQLALATNELDLAVLGFVKIGLMQEKGFRDSKVISAIFSGGQSLTLRNGVIAKTWKELEGKKIGTAPNSYADLLFKSSAKLGGADLAKINFVSFAPPGGTPVFVAMRSGDIDGFVFWEPNNAEAALQGIGSYSSLDIGDNPTGHITASKPVAEAPPGRTTRGPSGKSRVVESSTSKPTVCSLLGFRTNARAAAGNLSSSWVSVTLSCNRTRSSRRISSVRWRANRIQVSVTTRCSPAGGSERIPGLSSGK